MAKVCKWCGSTKFIKKGVQENAKTHTVVPRYKCKKCFRTFVKPKWTGSRAKDASKQPLNEAIEVLDKEIDSNE
jgi:transposase-like protein